VFLPAELLKQFSVDYHTYPALCLPFLQSQVPTELILLWLNMHMVLPLVCMAKQLAEQLATDEFQFLCTVLLSGRTMRTWRKCEVSC